MGLAVLGESSDDIQGLPNVMFTSRKTENVNSTSLLDLVKISH